MNLKDFEGIVKFKIIILGLIILLIAANIIGPLYFYQDYVEIFVSIQSIYMIKGVYYIIMTSMATYQALKILGRVERKEKHVFDSKNRIFHAIVIPIYQQPFQLLKITLQKLSIHSKAKSNYLIFLALEEHSEKPKQKGQKLKQFFKQSFKLVEYTIHKLQAGEAKGKASNQNYCLERMEKVLNSNNIDPSEVLFTTIDADNWMAQAYFQEVEYFLSKHDWKMDRYMFAPNQMFAINNRNVPILNRVMDYVMGSTIFLWSNNITKVQNAASNYSLSFNKLRQNDFFDTNPDAMCDDYHNSLRMIWKTQGKIQIIPIHVMVNMVSLQTGKGYLSEMNARFWQGQRHMRSLLDAAYSFNMLFKNSFNVRTFWATIAYFENHFIPLGLYLTAFMFVIFKLINGLEFTKAQMMIVNIEAIILPILHTLYYIVINKSSKVLFNGKGVSIKQLIQVIVLYKFAILLFTVIPQIIGTIRITLTTPTFDAAQKNVNGKTD